MTIKFEYDGVTGILEKEENIFRNDVRWNATNESRTCQTGYVTLEEAVTHLPKLVKSLNKIR
jgi:hypothetical protein